MIRLNTEELQLADQTKIKLIEQAFQGRCELVNRARKFVYWMHHREPSLTKPINKKHLNKLNNYYNELINLDLRSVALEVMEEMRRWVIVPVPKDLKEKYINHAEYH